ncbi:hypothetical protein DPM19_07235 [Actinomadura craniellae]|uniref:Lipoprotein n=1 Tax=Actinomadura craniellae TaxID=2231787 RepID=A0A365H8X5_9ACTN|nr:hypothetical protein [Actinomadura craniellae]RAY15580.1 hypothetical protein DPM19_07235 [Actinomadura craniellae]
MKKFMVTLTAATIAVAGCGGQEPAEVAGAERVAAGRVDVSVLRQGHVNSVNAETPAAAAVARGVGIVVAGTVEGFTEGRTSYVGDPASDDGPIKRVVMRIRVGKKVKGEDRHLHDGHAYAEVFAGAGQSARTPADFQRAIPKGTPVVLFGRTRPTPDQPASRGGGVPEGAPLVSALHPQSLVFEERTPATARAAAGTKLVGGIEDLDHFGPAWTKPRSIGELVTAIQQ